MSAITDLNVKDDASTRVEQILKGITDNPAPFWRGSLANVPFDGQIRLTANQEKQKNGVYKVTLKLEMPVMEVPSDGNAAGYVAAPKVAHTLVANISMFYDGRATSSNRADLLSMIVGLLQGATSSAGTGTLDQASAGDAFKSSTAPIPLMFIQGILPS